MRVRVTAGVVLAALIGLAAFVAPAAFAESTTSDYGSRLVTLINQARAQHGLRALTVASGTSTVALNWTSHMASQQALSHNPSLASQLESHGSPNWTTYGENVAAGTPSSADQMFQDYMNSPEHRDNILNAQYRYVGVGVIFDNSFAWNTLDFVDQYATTTTQSSTSTRSTTTAKPATTSTTTRPTTTTTTRTTRTTTAAKPATRTAPVAAPRTVAVRHVASRPATTAVAAQPHVTRAHAAAPHTTSATHTVTAAAPAVAHPASAPSPVALSTSVRDSDGNGHSNTTPILVALTIVMLVALRFTVAVTMRRRAGR